MTEPARLQMLGVSTFGIQSWKGVAFEVQCSTDLKNWEPVATVTYLTGTLDYTEAVGTPLTPRFYRVKSL